MLREIQIPVYRAVANRAKSLLLEEKVLRRGVRAVRIRRNADKYASVHRTPHQSASLTASPQGEAMGAPAPARQISVYRAVGDGFPVPGRRNASPTVFIVKCYEFAGNRCGIATFYCRAVNNRPYSRSHKFQFIGQFDSRTGAYGALKASPGGEAVSEAD